MDALTMPEVGPERAGRPAPSAAPRTGVPARVLLLGASNLARSLPGAVRLLVERFRGSELIIHAARGCGRSYGMEAGVPGFKTPGLSSCRLLGAVEAAAREAPGARIHALLTDIGNDILYQAGVECIAGWVRGIAERLLALGARVALTSLPVDSIEAILEWKFRLLRPLYYPMRPIARDEILRQVRELQARIEDLAAEKGLLLLPARTAWYGFDHFHLDRAGRKAAFRAWLEELLGPEPEPADARAAGEESRAPAAGVRLAVSKLALRFHLPPEYSLAGRRRVSPQRAVTLAPGARLYCH